MNVPIVIGALVAGRFLVPNSRSPQAPPHRLGRRRAVDRRARARWCGRSSKRRATAGPSPPILAGFAVAVLALGRVRRGGSAASTHPMLDVRFFPTRGSPPRASPSRSCSSPCSASCSSPRSTCSSCSATRRSRPGIRTLPFAVRDDDRRAVVVEVVEWLGTKRVVVTGMLIFATGLVVASTSTVDSGYPRIVIAMVLMGSGMGLALAPATESIMGSLPRDKAGVGSAVNDTSREVGGALGVAVVGSMLSSIYGSRFLDNVPASVPAASSRRGRPVAGRRARCQRAAGPGRRAARRRRTRGVRVRHVTRVAGDRAGRGGRARSWRGASCRPGDRRGRRPRRRRGRRCRACVSRCRSRRGRPGSSRPVPPRPQ